MKPTSAEMFLLILDSSVSDQEAFTKILEYSQSDCDEEGNLVPLSKELLVEIDEVSSAAILHRPDVMELLRQEVVKMFCFRGKPDVLFVYTDWDFERSDDD